MTTTALPPSTLRSLSDQGPAELGGTWSVLSRQKVDHVRLHVLLNALASTAPSEQRSVLLELYRLVFPHAFAEESVLWPVMRRVLPDGHDLTLRVEQEHQEVNELVTRLEELPLHEPAREPLLARLTEVLREDVRDEEDELLPRLQQVLEARRLRWLGVLWEIVRTVSPTRPHPVVARRPPGNVIAALPLTIIDRTRDQLERAALRTDGEASRWLPKLDQRLGRLSHAVERLPIMRAGEDASTRRAAARG